LHVHVGERGDNDTDAVVMRCEPTLDSQVSLKITAIPSLTSINAQGRGLSIFGVASAYRRTYKAGRLILGAYQMGSKVPRRMLPICEKIVAVTDNVCDQHLNQEYRELARLMTEALCRKRPSPLTSGQPRTWACGIVYVLGKVNFLSEQSSRPHMTTAELCAAFGASEGTAHGKARAIEEALTIRPLDPRWTCQSNRTESAYVDGRGEWRPG